jgi:hypothetical protein
MLVELSVVEQRYQAVLAVIRDGVKVVDVAHRFEVSRQAVHRWLRWYEDQGLPGLVDRSHRPPRCSHQMDPAVEVWCWRPAGGRTQLYSADQKPCSDALWRISANDVDSRYRPYKAEVGGSKPPAPTSAHRDAALGVDI